MQRLNADGSLDMNFGNDGYAIVPVVAATVYTNPALTAVEPNGRILAAAGGLYGIVGDPVVSFGDATRYSTSSGTPTAAYDVSETAGSATITLERGGDLSQRLSVPFSTDDSRADGGVNFTPIDTIVNFAAGSATTTVSIPIVADLNASPAVDIPLVLGSPGGGAVLGAYGVGDLHIEPTEGIVISSTQVPSVAQHGPSSTFTVVLQTVPTATVTIPVSISTTSPAAMLSASSLVFTPADALTPQVVTVTAVSGSGSQGSTPAIAGVTVGPASSSDLKFNGLTGGTVQAGVYNNAAATPGFVEFAAPNFTDGENAGAATITLVRLGGSVGTVTVHFTTSDGSPDSNGDYTPLSGSISFAAGVTTRTFSIALLDPGPNLDGDQTVDLTLSNPTGGAQLGVFPSATLTLHDPYTLSAGDLDPAFGANGAAVLPAPIAVNGSGSAAAAVPGIFADLPDGDVVLAATYGEGVVVWETTQTGQAVTTFGQDGVAEISLSSVPALTQIAVNPDGSFLVGGHVAMTDAAGVFLMKLNPDGSVDTSFGNGGEINGSYTPGDDELTSVIVESDDSILVGATVNTANDASSTAALIHYEPDGSLDIGFGTGGVLDLSSVPAGFTDMVQQPDGKLLFVINGSYNEGYYGNGGAVVRLDSDDTLDPSFGTDGVAPLNWGEFQSTAIVQPDGKILIGGGGSVQATLGRLNADGSIDLTFGQDGSVVVNFGNYGASFNSLAVEPGGKIVAVGNEYNPFGCCDSPAVAVFLPDGTPDPNFGADGSVIVTNGPPSSSTGLTLPDGDILVAGGVNSEPVIEAITTADTGTIIKVTSTIAWSHPGNMLVGTPLGATQLDATADIPGVFTYTPAPGTVLGLGEDQTLSVTFEPTDTTDYNSATDTVSINVVSSTKTTPTIFWTNPADITVGTLLSATQLDAMASVPGTFVYSPAAGTALSEGPNQTLSVTFTPTDTADFSSATATVRITVNPATGSQSLPEIYWTPPAAITYGTPLGPAQLDATASVPGVFDYLPLAGTIMRAGADQTISVVFHPADSTDYSSEIYLNSISVLPANSLPPTPSPLVYVSSVRVENVRITKKKTRQRDRDPVQRCGPRRRCSEHRQLSARCTSKGQEKDGLQQTGRVELRELQPPGEHGSAHAQGREAHAQSAVATPDRCLGNSRQQRPGGRRRKRGSCR